MSRPLVLVVEDEPALAELVSMHLKHGGYAVQWVADVAAAAQAVRDALPALVLLDWMLPGGPGLDLARQWRSQSRTRDLPIIMLTARAQEDDRIAGLDAGADDYLVKPFSPRELMARIRSVLRRRAPESVSDLVSVGPLSLDPSARKVQVGDQVLRLGPTEFRMLQVFMAHPARVLPRSTLLDKVWGDHVALEDRTVDVQVRRLREALAPAGLSAWIRTVRGVGYMLDPEADRAGGEP